MLYYKKLFFPLIQEASLRKGMNLEDLDQAIEGALCSELKDEYSQQKSSHDN